MCGLGETEFDSSWRKANNLLERVIGLSGMISSVYLIRHAGMDSGMGF